MSDDTLDGGKALLDGGNPILSPKIHKAPPISGALLEKLDRIVLAIDGNYGRNQVIQLGIELLHEAINKEIYLMKNGKPVLTYDFWKK